MHFYNWTESISIGNDPTVYKTINVIKKQKVYLYCQQAIWNYNWLLNLGY